MRSRRNPRYAAPRGAVTLLVAVVFLVLATLTTLYLNRSTLFDLKTSGNQYRQLQAFEIASLGLERGIAWLQLRALVPEESVSNCTTPPLPYTRAVWGARAGQTSQQAAADPYEYLVTTDPCNVGAPALAATDIGDASFDVTVEFRRRKGTIADLFRVEVGATARTTGFGSSLNPYDAQATMMQAVTLRQAMNDPAPANPNAPLLVRGGVSSVTGTPDICPMAPDDPNINQGNRVDCTPGTGTPGVAIATLQPTVTGFIEPGHFDTHGGQVNALNAPTKTAFDVLFPNMVEADILRLSEYQAATLPVAQRTIFYYGTGSSYGSSAPNNLAPVGTAAQPVLVFVSRNSYSGTNCPKLSPGEFFGILYMGGDCAANGWGNADVYGSVVVDGNLTKFSANTITRYSNLGSLTGNPGGLQPGQVSKIPGGWRDFRFTGES